MLRRMRSTIIRPPRPSRSTRLVDSLPIRAVILVRDTFDSASYQPTIQPTIQPSPQEYPWEMQSWERLG